MYHIEESYQKERRSAALIFSTKGKRIEGWEGGGGVGGALPCVEAVAPAGAGITGAAPRRRRGDRLLPLSELLPLVELPDGVLLYP